MFETTLSTSKTAKILAALEANWQTEMEGYYTYLALAARDASAIRSQVLRHLTEGKAS